MPLRSRADWPPRCAIAAARRRCWPNSGASWRGRMSPAASPSAMRSSTTRSLVATRSETRPRRWRLPDKRTFYGRSSVAADYERLRFGGPSGQWVNRRELKTVGRLLEGLPAAARVLDVACGTGRLAHRLAPHRVVALDSSPPMLERVPRPLAAPVQADAFALPFADRAFDGFGAL